MAEYRTLHTKIWQDEWFCDLRPDAKLLFVYLVTNRAASVAGIYKLPPKFIAFETGIKLSRVMALMAEFQAAGKVYQDGDVIWVKRLRAYQTYHGEATRQVQVRIDKDLADIPDSTLKRAYLAFYSTGAEPSIPTAYPPDTHPIPTPETETETETETDRGAKAPPARKVVKHQYPAVEVFRTASGAYPNKTLWQSMDEEIGSKPDDLTFWQQVVTAWVAKGWNPRNIQGMFDFYKRRELPANGNGHKQPVVNAAAEYRAAGYTDANGNPV